MSYVIGHSLFSSSSPDLMHHAASLGHFSVLIEGGIAQFEFSRRNTDEGNSGSGRASISLPPSRISPHSLSCDLQLVDGGCNFDSARVSSSLQCRREERRMKTADHDSIHISISTFLFPSRGRSYTRAAQVSLVMLTIKVTKCA